MTFNWNSEKNKRLKQERNISFEDIVIAISENRIVTVLEHPNKKKYPEQMLYLIEFNNYIYVVPFVLSEQEDEIFFKTIFPSRAFTKKYLNKGEN